MIPQIESITQSSEIEVVTQPSLTYKDRTKSITGKTDGQRAIVQTADHIVNKERYAYAIYPNWFGIELEKYKGESFEYLEAQIEEDLKSALLQDDRIYDIIVTKVEQINIDSAHVIFDMYTIEGTIEGLEVNVVV